MDSVRGELGSVHDGWCQVADAAAATSADSRTRWTTAEIPSGDKHYCKIAKNWI